MSVLWVLVSILAVVAIIGIPWSRACWVISVFACTPFEKEVIDRLNLTLSHVSKPIRQW